MLGHLTADSQIALDLVLLEVSVAARCALPLAAQGEALAVAGLIGGLAA